MDAMYRYLPRSLRKKAVRRRNRALVHRAVDAVFPGRTVVRGPFRGLRFPPAAPVGWDTFSKLIGSYEAELHPVIEAACARGYTEVINIGCADGYYAGGMAMRLGDANVYAYDIDSNARRACQDLISQNHLADRVEIGTACDAETLMQIPIRRRALVVCDCEGYELDLLTQDVAGHLADHDLLVELHDHVDLRIPAQIRERFTATHEIEVLESIDDIRRAQTADYPELSDYSLDDRLILLRERRGYIMQWFRITSRAGA